MDGSITMSTNDSNDGKDLHMFSKDLPEPYPAWTPQQLFSFLPLLSLLCLLSLSLSGFAFQLMTKKLTQGGV